MMRRVATPGEVSRWEQSLAPHLPPERVAAVVGMLAEVVDDCPHCGEPVRRADERLRRGERLAHLRCARRAK